MAPKVGLGTTLVPAIRPSHIALPIRALAQMRKGASADQALDQARAVWAGLWEPMTYLEDNTKWLCFTRRVSW